MTIPDEAVQAARDAIQETEFADVPTHENMVRALTAALPFLTGVMVKDLSALERLAKLADDYDLPDENGPFPDIQDAMVTVGDLRKVRKIFSELSAIEFAPSPRDELLKQIREGTAYGFINDGSHQEGNPDLDCPYCGGSGHKADVPPSPRAQALEEAARFIEKNIEVYGSDGVEFRPRQEGNRNALAYAAAIRALSSQPVADGWLPIETAPKDKTIIGFGRMVGVNLCYHNGKQWNKTELLASFQLSAQAITHWRPLPASPGASDTRPTGGSDADA